MGDALLSGNTGSGLAGDDVTVGLSSVWLELGDALSTGCCCCGVALSLLDKRLNGL